jgi:hypothetical protein
MPTNLPNVAVLVIDCVAHELTQLAINKTLEEITPADIICISDRNFTGETTNFYHCIRSMEEVERARWSSPAGIGVLASHVLHIQYDGFVLDGTRWNPSWIQYDYIGAPWPWHTSHNVGNGGFSLRSTKLMRFLANNPTKFPPIIPEDETLCREYRPALEAEGFQWAPLDVASEFSFEREAPRSTFGFHGIFNVPKVLPSAEYLDWKSLANNYVRSKIEWKELP